MTKVQTRTGIQVTVTFPITKKKEPFQERAARDAAVGAVRTAAMGYFEVQDDSQFVYVLAHDGVEEANDRTIGEVAGPAEAVKFTLVKKIAQG